MNSQHTPGPWEIEYRNGSTNIRAANQKPVAECWIHEDSGPNSRLIASAPDLLYACMLLDEAEGTADDAADGRRKFGIALRAARAAIARATGAA